MSRKKDVKLKQSGDIASVGSACVSQRKGCIKITFNNTGHTFTFFRQNSRGNIAVCNNGVFIDGIEVTPQDSEEYKISLNTIAEVYDKLVQVVNEYLSKSGTDRFKHHLFTSLLSTLENPPEKSKYDRIMAFKNAINTADQCLIKKHRNSKWILFLYNIFSVLTLIPAVIRAGISYQKFGTFQFWKPESEKVIGFAKSQIDTTERIAKQFNM